MSKSSSIVSVIVALAVVGSGSFYAGMNYEKRTSSTQQLGSQGAGGQRFGGGVGAGRGARGGAAGFAGGDAVVGEVLAKDDKSLTIKLRDGGSKIVFISSSTTVDKNVRGTLADLAVGTQVMANGTADASGSITARSVQIVPQRPTAPKNPSPSPTQPKTPGATENIKTFTINGDNFSFTPSEMKVKKGDTVKVIFKNDGGFHDFVLDEFNARTPKIQGGATADVQFVADKTGSFEYYCSIGEHRAMGMKGTLIVE